MELPPLSAEDLKQSDEDLGEWLISTLIGHHAQQAGFALNDVPREWVKWFVEKAAKTDSESVTYALLENAFRKGCRGDMAAAGRMLRSYLAHQAAEQVGEKFANIGIERTVSLKRAGQKGVESKKAAAALWQAECVQKARKLLAQRRNPRELASILAPQFSKTPRQVRAVLKKAEVT